MNMNLSITTFVTPFSFFCKVANDDDDHKFQVYRGEGFHSSKAVVSNASHGRYVAVLWNNKWARGVVSLEKQFLIWLIDHGIYLHPDENTVYMDLPTEFKKLPTKVFEASIHGVAPVDKVLTDDCKIQNKVTTSWNNGATERALVLLENASKVMFVPVALLTTNDNDIVLGDLYLKRKSDRRFINIIDELKAWPVFLESNKESYVENLSTYYANSHRKHRASTLKPEFPDFELPPITLSITMSAYDAICAKAPQLEDECLTSDSSKDGSTVVASDAKMKKEKDLVCYQLTASKEEEYSNTWITLRGEEYNVLELVKRKLEDLKMCVKYRDVKYIGRATTRQKRNQS